MNGLDSTFLLIGGGAQGSLGEVLTWALAIVGSLAIIAIILNGRRQRFRYGFPVRPMWAEIALIVVGCGAILGIAWFANNNFWPQGLAERIALEEGWGPAPAGGWRIPTGFPLPIVLLIGVTLVMTWMATRRQFGRYVYAYGGNPDAAELGGINTRSDDPQDVRADGHPVRPGRGHRVCSAQRVDPRHRPELRAVRHRRRGRRRDVVRRRHRDDPRRRARRLRHAVARRMGSASSASTRPARTSSRASC